MLSVILAAIVATKAITGDQTIRLYDEARQCETGYYVDLVEDGKVTDTGCWTNTDGERFVVYWNGLNATVHYTKNGTRKVTSGVAWAIPALAIPLTSETAPASP